MVKVAELNSARTTSATRNINALTNEEMIEDVVQQQVGSKGQKKDAKESRYPKIVEY